MLQTFTQQNITAFAELLKNKFPHIKYIEFKSEDSRFLDAIQSDSMDWVELACHPEDTCAIDVNLQFDAPKITTVAVTFSIHKFPATFKHSTQWIEVVWNNGEWMFDDCSEVDEVEIPKTFEGLLSQVKARKQHDKQYFAHLSQHLETLKLRD